MRTIRLGLTALLALAGLAACARTVSVEGPASLAAAFSRCPLPIQWVTEDPRPLGIRIRNEDSDTVAVFLDRCTGHTRIGDVGPGSVRTFRLAPPLIDYGSGLRFFVYPGHELERFHVASLPVDTARVLQLTVTSGTPSTCESRVYVDGEPHPGTLRELGLVREEILGVHLEYERPGDDVAAIACPVVHVRTRAGASGAGTGPVGRPRSDS
jgi:hypothetical protein